MERFALQAIVLLLGVGIFLPVYMSGFPISLYKGGTASPCIWQGTGIPLYTEGTTIPQLAARVIVRLDFYPACADIRYENLCVADQSQLNHPTMSRSVSILASALLKPLGGIPVHKRWTSD